MSVIQSKIDTQSEEFSRKKAEMMAAIEEFRAVEEAIQKNAERVRERIEKRGQLMPRDRLELLLDRGAPFLELCGLAGHKMYDDKDGSAGGGGLIAGIGYVSGVRCMAVVHNIAIKGGTICPAGLKKALRLQYIALKNKLPIVTLAESGGANLLYQAIHFVEGGEGFANQARLSAAGIPQVTVVHGSSTAGGAYIPGLSDYVIMVKKKAKIFLAGPPLLKAATGEIATDEELGGAEMHASVVGTAEYLAEDDRDGIRLAREVVASLGWKSLALEREAPGFPPPRYDIEELLGAVPVGFKKNYDVREVIARLVDDSEFLEFKALYDPYTICGRSAIKGMTVGIIGSNGPITAKGAVKAAQFIQLCCQSDTPIVYLHNTTGYMVGTEAEQNGIVKHGSKMIQAVANATVPQITIVIGGSFGAGHYGMCGRGLNPRFIFSWPNARIGVMGGEQAARVMSILTTEKMKREGKEPDPSLIKAMEKEIVDRMDAESHVLFGTARLWDDGIIDPRDTRKVLAYTLSISLEGDARKVCRTNFGIARF